MFAPIILKKFDFRICYWHNSNDTSRCMYKNKKSQFLVGNLLEWRLQTFLRETYYKNKNRLNLLQKKTTANKYTYF